MAGGHGQIVCGGCADYYVEPAVRLPLGEAVFELSSGGRFGGQAASGQAIGNTPKLGQNIGTVDRHGSVRFSD
jgi:hypothetical protein